MSSRLSRSRSNAQPSGQLLSISRCSSSARSPIRASPTSAQTSVERCHLSWPSVSETAAPNRRSRSFSDLTSLRFPFRSRISPKWRRASTMQMNVVTTGWCLSEPSREPSSGYLLPALLESLLDLLDLEELEHVSDLHVGVALQHDAALHPGLDLGDVVLEAAQRADPAAPDDGPVPDQPHARGAGDLAVVDLAAGDRPDPRGLECLQDLGAAQRLLDLLRLEQALHRRAKLLGHLVDHGVGADVDALALGGAAGLCERPHVEADDDRVRGGREHHVRFVDSAGLGVDHVDRDLLLRQL